MQVAEEYSVGAASTTAQKRQPRWLAPSGLSFLCVVFASGIESADAQTRGKRGFESRSDEPASDVAPPGATSLAGSPE